MTMYSKERSLSDNDSSNSVPSLRQQRDPNQYRHRMRPLFPIQKYVLARQKQQRSYRRNVLKRYAIHLVVFFTLLGVSIVNSLDSVSGFEQLKDMHNSRILAPADVYVNDFAVPSASTSIETVPFDTVVEEVSDNSEEQQEEQPPRGAFIVLESVDETVTQEVPVQAQVEPAQPVAPAPQPAPAQPAPEQPAPVQPTPAPAAPQTVSNQPYPTSYDDYASYYSTGCCIWPAQGRISSQVTRWHMALDIANAYGTPVVAADGGRVIAAGWDNTGYGYRVIINHGNGISTLYAHLSRYFVNYGDFVSKGQLIGNIGATGWASGPHLHFEVRRNNYRENPYNWLP